MYEYVYVLWMLNKFVLLSSFWYLQRVNIPTVVYSKYSFALAPNLFWNHLHVVLSIHGVQIKTFC